MGRNAMISSAQDESASEAVVAAVAQHTGTDPISLEPLYTAVDPDALDALFGFGRPGVDRSSTRVTFTYCGCEVTVSGDGTVRVSESGVENPSETPNVIYDVRS